VDDLEKKIVDGLSVIVAHSRYCCWQYKTDKNNLSLLALSTEKQAAVMTT